MSKTGLAILLLLIYGAKRIIANPVYGLYAFILVLSLQPQKTYGWDPIVRHLHIHLLVGLLTFIGFLKLRRANPQTPLVSNTHNVLIIAFWGVILASLIYNQLNPWHNKMFHEFTRSLVLYFLVINLVDSEEKLVQLMWVWVGTYAYMSFLAIHRHSIGWYRNCKPYMWLNKNHWGVFITQTMPLAAGLVWNVYERLIKNRMAMRWLALIPLVIVRIIWRHEPIVSLIVLGVAAVLFWSPDEKKLKLCWRFVAGIATLAAIVNGMWCRSRSAYLTTVCCVGLIALYEMRRLPRVALISIVIVATASYVGRHRIVNTYNSIMSYETDGSAGERIRNMYIAMEYMADSPMLGIGPGQFIPRTMGRNTHSSYFQVGAELGFAGLIVYLGMVLLTLVRCARNWLVVRHLPQMRMMGELSVYIGIAFCAWAVQAFFQGVVYNHETFMLMGLTVAAETIIRRHVQQETVQEQLRKMSLPRVAPAPVLRTLRS